MLVSDAYLSACINSWRSFFRLDHLAAVVTYVAPLRTLKTSLAAGASEHSEEALSSPG